VNRSFFDRNVQTVCREVIGAELLVNGVGGTIVEVEAYEPTDPASHSYLGRRTARNAAMFGPPGSAYVYRSYGIHWCLNFTCGAPHGAILIRALEPTHGLDEMRARRGLDDIRLLCAGPGRLTEALGVTRDYDGLPLDRPPFALSPPEVSPEIVTGRRIGLTKAVENPWRYGLAGSRFVSRPFPRV
jgi:DNA-3-methyladenine glycosylase